MTVRARYLARKAAGVCVTCGKNPARKGRVSCQPCAHGLALNVILWRQRKRHAGLCIRCGRPAVTRNHCRQHADAATAYTLKRYHAKKRAAR